MTNNVEYCEDIQNMIIGNLDGWTVEGEIPVTVTDSEDDDGDETETTVETTETATETTETTETETATETTTTSTSTRVNPFMTSSEVQEKANKTITVAECMMFYEEALDLAYMHTNRLNIDDLTTVEARMFIRAVCKWTASNLWNKYNIRVNNEDMEDTYVQSYGGLLYKSALKTLNLFINQRITSVSRIREDEDETVNPWIV